MFNVMGKILCAGSLRAKLLRGGAGCNVRGGAGSDFKPTQGYSTYTNKFEHDQINNLKIKYQFVMSRESVDTPSSYAVLRRKGNVLDFLCTFKLIACVSIIQVGGREIISPIM